MGAAQKPYFLCTLGAAGMDDADAATVLIYSKIDAIKGDAFFFYQKLNFSLKNTI